MTLTFCRVPAIRSSAGELPAPNGSVESWAQSSVSASVAPLAPVNELTSSASPVTEASMTPPSARLAVPPWRLIAVHLRRSGLTSAVASATDGVSSATVSDATVSDSPNEAETDSWSIVKVVRRAFVSAGAVTVTSDFASVKWPEPETTPAIVSAASVPSTWKASGELPAPNGSVESWAQSSVSASVAPLAPVNELTSSASPVTEASMTPPSARLAVPPWRLIAVHLRRSGLTSAVASATDGVSSATVSDATVSDSPNEAETDSWSIVKVVRRAFVSAGAVTVTSDFASVKWPEPETTPAIVSAASVPSTWKASGELPAPNGSVESWAQSSVSASVAPLAPVNELTSSASPVTEASMTPPSARLAVPPWRLIAVHLRRSGLTSAVASATDGVSSATVSDATVSDSPNEAETDSWSIVKVVRRAFVSAGAVTVTSDFASVKWPEPETTPAIVSAASVPSTWKASGELPAPNGSVESWAQSSVSASVAPLAPVNELTSSASPVTEASMTPPSARLAVPPWRLIAVHLRRSGLTSAVASATDGVSSATVSDA